MPFFLSDFISQNTGIELQMDVTNKSSVLESLERNEVDFSLVSILPSSINVERIDLLQNKIFLVGKEPKVVNSKKRLKDFFEGMPIIYRENGSGTRQTMESFIN